MDCGFHQGLISGNFDEYFDMYYPRVVAIRGWKAAVTIDMKAERKMLKAAMSYNIAFELPDQITEAGGRSFALLPYTIEMTSAARTVRMSFNLLAISEEPAKVLAYNRRRLPP